MNVDWHLVAQIAVPLLTLVLGLFLNRWTRDRPRLVTYLSHASAIRSKTPEGMEVDVHFHSIVLRNAGRRTAVNVRIGHYTLPAFQIFPSIDHSVHELPDGSKEIVVPRLVPKEQITVNYLYFPPTLWRNINSYTKSDEGIAKVVNMIPAQQYSRKVQVSLAMVFMVGIVSILYLIGLLVKILI